METTVLSVAATLALLAGTTSAAELHQIEWRGAASEATHEVAPRKIAEWCGKLARGEKIAWQFEAAAPVDFNIHYHEGKNVHYPEKRAAAGNAEGTLDVPLDQDYCWMWTNASDRAVTVKAQLRKAR